MFAACTADLVVHTLYTQEGLVTADNHTFIIQPRVNNEEELIIYEVDKEHLPHNYIDGTGIVPKIYIRIIIYIYI